MVDTAREMGFPMLAGSSLPVTWRTPSLDMPYGARVAEAVCVACGGIDGGDIHALETMQCMVERREGGESGEGSRGGEEQDRRGGREERSSRAEGQEEEGSRAG